MFTPDDIIYTYTRQQALDDQVLIDVTQLASEAGFKYPVAISAALHNDLIPTEQEHNIGQDYTGRLWDVLYLASVNARNAPPSTDLITFTVLIATLDNGRVIYNEPEIAMHIGPGDNLEPVITICYPIDL